MWLVSITSKFDEIRNFFCKTVVLVLVLVDVVVVAALMVEVVALGTLISGFFCIFTDVILTRTKPGAPVTPLGE
jgi:asparagine N-glycosylation enzyme membrane subunit Stt3